jgi:CRP-like cAMP-binding protein
MSQTISLANFASSYPAVFFVASETIVHPGDLPQDIYVLESGSVHQLDISPTGNEVIINIFAPPAFLSVFWLFEDIENRFTYRAVDQVVARKIPRAEMQKYLLENPQFTYDTMQRLVRGLDGFVLKLTHQMYGTAEQKIATELVIEARRFHKNSKLQIPLKIGVNDIAARTGLARETVSRQLQKMIVKKLIEKSASTIIITDLAKLEQLMQN